jgi:hypothetical protein
LRQARGNISAAIGDQGDPAFLESLVREHCAIRLIG